MRFLHTHLNVLFQKAPKRSVTNETDVFNTDIPTRVQAFSSSLLGIKSGNPRSSLPRNVPSRESLSRNSLTKNSFSRNLYPRKSISRDSSLTRDSTLSSERYRLLDPDIIQSGIRRGSRLVEIPQSISSDGSTKRSASIPELGKVERTRLRSTSLYPGGDRRKWVSYRDKISISQNLCK